MLSTSYELKPEMYFPYPAPMTTTVMAPTFSQYNVPPMQGIDVQKDDSYSSESNCSRSKSAASSENYQSPRTASYQQKSDSSFEDDESRRNVQLMRRIFSMNSYQSGDGSRRSFSSFTIHNYDYVEIEDAQYLPRYYRYRERRDKNNIAAKRSRLNRKERERRMARQVAELERENAELRQQVAIYMQQLEILKKQCDQSFTPLSPFSYPTIAPPTILRENTINILSQQQCRQQQQHHHQQHQEQQQPQFMYTRMS